MLVEDANALSMISGVFVPGVVIRHTSRFTVLSNFVCFVPIFKESFISFQRGKLIDDPLPLSLSFIMSGVSVCSTLPTLKPLDINASAKRV